jgi:formamidopyrimidine-DNA glycosylase
MPELPEVEVIKKSLNHRLKKQSITNVWTSKFRMRSQLTAQDKELVKGKMIEKVSRIGKFLVIQLSDSFLLLHFGMSGRLLIARNNEEIKKIQSTKHVHFLLGLSSICIFLHDQRRFGGVRLVRKSEADSIVSLKKILNIGVDPLEDIFRPCDFFKKTARVKRNIKSYIMDGSKIAGVGNIYATESLFRAGVNPETPTNKLSLAAWSRIIGCIQFVLTIAIKQGGSTLRDFADPTGKRGDFTTNHLVYGKKNLTCIVCNACLDVKLINQRTTVFCKFCQKRN